MSGSRTILFLMRNLYYLRNFEAPLRMLATRGFRTIVLSDPNRQLPTEVMEQKAELCRDFPDQFEFGDSYGRIDSWRNLADEIHCARDLLRYHHPRFANASTLRQRAIRKATPIARKAFAASNFGDSQRNSGIDDWLNQVDERIPVDASIVRRISEISPDLVIVTPLIDFRTSQIDWLRAARHLSIPSVLAVASWDNLTNKGRIQAMPDRVIVWNGIQKREAIELHNVPENRIVVTGAQLYDDWFQRQPSRDRLAFCDELGLLPDRPIVLYVGSSASIAKDEPRFVRRWLEALRSSPDTRLRQSNVLIRPHPMNQEIFRSFEVQELAPVVVHPRAGGFPVTKKAREDYFDALYHCAALVGLNTSALVEASILGKRCYSLRDPANTRGQEGTLHFGHLTKGGIVRHSQSMVEHLDSLSQELNGFSVDSAEIRSFVHEFLRPNGLDQAATPIFVEAVEKALNLQVCPSREITRAGTSLQLAKFGATIVRVSARFFRRVYQKYIRRIYHTAMGSRTKPA